MPTYKLKPAGSGQCCPCNQINGCGCDDACTIECRKRGGTATLCGKSEWGGHESVPPKKYRLYEPTGSATSGPCDGSSSSTEVLSGSASWDASTCQLTNDCILTRDGVPETFGVGEDSPCPSSTCTFTHTCGATQRTAVPTGTCCGGTTRVTGAGFTHTLSQEDTETDAIARLLASAGGTWSTWKTQGDEAECGGVACCIAVHGTRGAGEFSFAYEDVEVRLSKDGLLPDTSYQIEVDVFRRPEGATEWTLYQTLTLSDTSDAEGRIELTHTTPNDAGFETYITNCRYRLS